MLATLTGLQGGAHYGFGKGCGGLLGGIAIDATKSTHKVKKEEDGWMDGGGGRQSRGGFLKAIPIGIPTYAGIGRNTDWNKL